MRQVAKQAMLDSFLFFFKLIYSASWVQKCDSVMGVFSLSDSFPLSIIIRY